MKRVAMLLAVLCLGCPEEKMGPGEATPLSRTTVPALPPGPPAAVKPAEPAPPVAPPVAQAPAAPSAPAGLTRSKVGDLVEFSWSRTGETRLEQGNAMAMVMGSGGKPIEMEKLKQMAAPRPSIKTGTVSVIRVAPETPFTFRVEIKSGKDVEQSQFAYGPDIAIDKVLFRTDPDDPKKKAKAGGTVFDCVETPSRLIAPDASSLALSGGLVSETSLEATRVGSVSVALTRFGTTRPPAGIPAKTRLLDSFETPIAIAIQQVQKFGIVDPAEKAERDAEVQRQVGALATPCLSLLKPSSGVLEGVIAGGKVEALRWGEGPAPRPFVKCLTQQLKKMKLPQEETFLNLALPLSK
ncbi:MAG: hypothetical protein H6Q89_836 [Myxococcaceae bacterium]|nr:hypothetical protein [Myxococcaceae bacterium]